MGRLSNRIFRRPPDLAVDIDNRQVPASAGVESCGVDDARRDRFRSAGESLLAAIAYGDAAGAPYEGEPARPIHVRQLVGYDSPVFGPSPAGGWTDDTQLSLAVARALIASDQFDLDRIADEHLRQLHQTPKATIGDVTLVRGWGPSTVAAVDRYRCGAPPADSGTPNGAGNGVLMKMAPLVWWQSATGPSEDAAIAQWDALTAFTHRSLVARVCTRVHGTVLRRLLEHPDLSGADTIALALAAARHHEQEIGAPPHTSAELQIVGSWTPGACEQQLRDHVCRLSPHGGGLYGFYAPETLAVVYGALLRWGTVGRTLADLVYHVIGLGGDTDSTASILAATAILATGGAIELPEDMNTVQRVDDLTALSVRLAATALGPR